jgi:putative endonuclease
MFTVYAIVSKTTKKVYIGQTIDLEERLKQHNDLSENHLGRFTKYNKGPWNLVYEEKCPTRSEALMRERQPKSYRGREFIRSLINNLPA